MSAKKQPATIQPSPTAEEIHRRSMAEGRAIIEKKIGKAACDRIFSAPSNLGKIGEDEVRLLNLDHAALSKYAAFLVSPTGKLRDRDPELVDMLAQSLRHRNRDKRDFQHDKDCAMLLLNRIRDGSMQQLDAMFKTIILMKRQADSELREKNRNAEVLIHWNRFRLMEGRLPDSLAEFAADLVRSLPDYNWPSLTAKSSWRKWGEIWKAVGLSHRAARTGSRKD